MSIKDIQNKIIEFNKKTRQCECGKIVASWVSICDDCIKKEKEELKRKDLESMEAYKTENFKEFCKACGIPELFIDVPQADKLLTDSLFVTGDFGTGKTYKAISILKGYIQGLPSDCFVSRSIISSKAFFITAPELLLKIRANIESEENIVNQLSSIELLVIDDLGAEKTSEWVLQTFYIILNRRYSDKLQTIITSNLSLDELREKLGDRIASRIAGMCKIIQLHGKDKRLK